MKAQGEDPTKSAHQFFQAKQVDRTRKALERNGFETQVVPDAQSAVTAIMEMIPDGATVGVGGSMTLNQIGFSEAVNGRTITLLNPFAHGIAPEERNTVTRQIFSCDYFLCSTNAITEEGQLYNIDATGNRVGAMFFGPRKTVVVCGINKIVKDMEEARKRVWNQASPMNAKRLGRKTPCAETGVCSDCNSPERICNIAVEILKKPSRTDVLVLLVEEPLGF